MRLHRIDMESFSIRSTKHFNIMDIFDKLKEERLQRIEERKKVIKSKKDRRMMKYSENYNEMFNFFLKGYRSGLLSFCGSKVDVKYNPLSEDGKFSFRMFDNGQFKYKDIETLHPNILKGVITGKKAWGLWKSEFAMGIAECNFTKDEIVSEFTDKGIKIPDVFMKEFDNEILRFKIKRYEEYQSNKK
jgi:hypothetical protein